MVVNAGFIQDHLKEIIRDMSKKCTLRYYPIAVRLNGIKSVVVGGGKIAQRKVLQLLDTESHVQFISPEATLILRRLAEKQKVRWTKRYVIKSDLSDVDIIIAATNDVDVNRKVSKWAQDNKTWVNVVDNPGLSNFISPAVFRLKKSIITVYTDGKDPVLSRDVKNFLKERWDDFLSYRHRLQKASA